MARLQGRIVINPKVLTDNRDALAIAYNEAYRMVMEANNFEPMAEPTEEQKQFFADTAYANDPLQLKRTITARIATYDDSVPNPTPEQYQDVVNMLEMVQQAGVIQNQEEEDVVSSTLEDMTEKAGQMEQLQPMSEETMPQEAMPVEPGAMEPGAMPVEPGAMPTEQGAAPMEQGAEGPMPQDIDPAMLQQLMSSGEGGLMAQAADKGGKVFNDDEEGNLAKALGPRSENGEDLEAIQKIKDKQAQGLILVNGQWRKPAKSGFMGYENPDGTIQFSEEGRREAVVQNTIKTESPVINDNVYKGASDELKTLQKEIQDGAYGAYFAGDDGKVTWNTLQAGVESINGQLSGLDEREKQARDDFSAGKLGEAGLEATLADIQVERDSLSKSLSKANRAVELKGIKENRKKEIEAQYHNMSDEELVERAAVKGEMQAQANDKARTTTANKQIADLKGQWDKLKAERDEREKNGEDTSGIDAQMARLEEQRDAIKGRVSFRNNLRQNIRGMAVKAAAGDFNILDWASPELKRTMSLSTVDRINSTMNGTNNMSLRNQANPYYRNLQRIAAKYGNADASVAGDWVNQMKNRNQWS